MSTDLKPWRETADPFSLPFQTFSFSEILDYPHAGNDVFHVRGSWKGEECRAYVKLARQRGADIANEVSFLQSLPYDRKPALLDFGLAAPAFDVTRECPGQRLSVILRDAPPEASLQYMGAYGAALAEFHSLAYPAEPVKHRPFFDMPAADYLREYGLSELGEYLLRHAPEGESRCLVHGDFHYANLLWEAQALTAVLDYELTGWGAREFDIAWALVLRPGQRFLNSLAEIRRFLEAYRERQSFSPAAFLYYYVQIALYFYSLGDEAYRADLRRLLRSLIACAPGDLL